MRGLRRSPHTLTLRAAHIALAGTALRSGPRPSPCRYSPKCVEEEFSEVHRSKRLIGQGGQHSTTAWWHPFGIETWRLSSIRCTAMYQGVATRNGATT